MKLNKFDLERALKLLPVSLQSVMITEGIVVAGGFLRCVVTKERIKDIDCFCKTKEEALKAAQSLNVLNTKLGETKLSTSKNAHSIKDVEGKFVQFIHRWCHPDPESLLKSFDFTIAKAAMWYDPNTGWESLVDENFYPDVAARRLVFQHPERQEDPAGSLLRVLKFVKKGYNVPNESLAGVVARVSQHACKLQPGEALNAILEAPYGDQEQEAVWTRRIHSSFATVTGES